MFSFRYVYKVKDLILPFSNLLGEEMTKQKGNLIIKTSSGIFRFVSIVSAIYTYRMSNIYLMIKIYKVKTAV